MTLFNNGSREVWDEIDSPSDGILWGDWGFGSVAIIDGRSEGVAIVLERVDLGYMYSM